MKRLLAIVMLCGLALGCPQLGTVAEPVLTESIVANNSMAEALDRLQHGAQQMRKAALLNVAKTADDVADGRADMDAIDRRFAPVFEALAKAETAQNALADALEAAQAALRAGQQPDVNALLELYAAVQQAYNGVAVALAEVQ